MSKNTQAEDGFPSLAFAGRHTLYAFQAAELLGCSTQHIFNLIEEGALGWLDLTGRNNISDRKSIRIPMEAWRKFLAERSHPTEA